MRSLLVMIAACGNASAPAKPPTPWTTPAGWAERTSCGTGALWVFVLAPEASPVRAELDALAATARCGQPIRG